MKLTAGELLFAAARTGGEVFFGIPDPFFGMDGTEMARELVELQLSMEKKGYASMGFDDAFKLNPEAEGLISICSRCERYIAADWTLPGGRRQSLLFYLRGDRAVEVRGQADGLALRLTEPGEIAEGIWNALDWPEGEGAAPWEAVSLPLADLTQARDAAKDDPVRAEEILSRAGCAGTPAHILLDGLREKAGYYAICAVDIGLRTLEHLVCVRADSGAAWLNAVHESDGERWELRPVDGRMVRELLGRLCKGGGVR